MFWKRRRYERGGLALASAMSEQKRIEARSVFVMTRSLKGPVHLMTSTHEGATAHADYLARVGNWTGVEIAQLSLAGPDSARVATVLVGSLDEFIAAFNSGLRPQKGTLALVEGEPPPAARSMLRSYRTVKLS